MEKRNIITANALISSIFSQFFSDSLLHIPPPPASLLSTTGRKLPQITYSFICRQVAVQIWSYSKYSSQCMQVPLFTTSRLISLACMWLTLYTNSNPHTNSLQRYMQNTCWHQRYFKMTQTSHRCLAKIQNSPKREQEAQERVAFRPFYLFKQLTSLRNSTVNLLQTQSGYSINLCQNISPAITVNATICFSKNV